MDRHGARFFQTAIKLARDICNAEGKDFESITAAGILHSIAVPGSDLKSHGWIPWPEENGRKICPDCHGEHLIKSGSMDGGHEERTCTRCDKDGFIDEPENKTNTMEDKPNG